MHISLRTISTAVVLCPLLLLTTWVPARAQIGSCKDLESLLAKPLPEDSYRRYLEAKKGAEFLAQFPSDCKIWTVERTRFTYADSLHGVAKTFPPGTDPAMKWAKQAAEQYQNYLEWFFALQPSDVTALYIAVKHVDPGAPDLERLQGAWLRQRVGNVLNSLGNAYELAQSYTAMLDTYSSLCGQPSEWNKICVQSFPTQVIEKWYRWLRSMPDFKGERSTTDLKSVLQSREDCFQEWSMFADFLTQFLEANPSARTSWEKRRQMVQSWLEA